MKNMLFYTYEVTVTVPFANKKDSEKKLDDVKAAVQKSLVQLEQDVKKIDEGSSILAEEC